MQIEMIKQPNGYFCPAADFEADRLMRFKNGEQYTVEIKLTRNPAFHRKVFAFFKFCFDHWRDDHMDWQLDEEGQFNVFRKNLTCLAGYYEEYFNIKGEVRIEAKSLAYANMEPEEFERCYKALINAALKHIFKTMDVQTENQLLGFF